MAASAGHLGTISSDGVSGPSALTVVDYRVLFGLASYSLIGSTRKTDLPWQITGIQVVFNEPVSSGDATSLGGIATTGVSGLGTDTLTWSIVPLTNGQFVTTLAGSGAHALMDAGGNPLNGESGFSQNFNVLYGDADDDGQVTSNDIYEVYWGQPPAPFSPFNDLNGDGAVDGTDVTIAAEQQFNTLSPVITVSGGGTAILAAADSLAQGANVVSGTLVVTSANALSDGSSLTVGTAWLQSVSNGAATTGDDLTANTTKTAALAAAPSARALPASVAQSATAGANAVAGAMDGALRQLPDRRAVDMLFAQRFAANVPWLVSPASSWSSSDQREASALVAREAALAQDKP